MAEYRNIGKLVSTFGVKGEMILAHHLGKKSSLKNLEAVFIEIKKDEMLPYFIEQTKIKSDEEIFLKLEGVNSKEAAKKLLQKEIWLAEADFEKQAGKSAPISLVGFRLIDKQNDLGEIVEVIEQPHQVLCKILINSKEVLIPIHERTLQKIDKTKKQVHVNLPEGLLEVYL
ncbi:MAG: 16S rRNA processing protein RimM [Bacteroidetes bacterium]|nr:16S rRNA processing protein RimM [Bacteroidota bacterium]MBS1975007.1 16S rRNA processing protein RimM [Bacteroidota bacterium]